MRTTTYLPPDVSSVGVQQIWIMSPNCVQIQKSGNKRKPYHSFAGYVFNQDVHLCKNTSKTIGANTLVEGPILTIN